MNKTLDISPIHNEQTSKSAYYPLFFKPLYKEALWGGKLMSTLGRDVPQSEMPIGESWEIVDRPDSQSCVTNGELEGKTLRELIELDPQGIVGQGHLAETPFPLLLKIIDADKDLSLQVHPDEECCKYIEGAEPKTEMWYVLDHKEEAQIMAGINDDVTEELFCSLINKPAIRHFMKSYSSSLGQSYFIKATTMHAIGGGNLIYEIQQNSNTTYRVSDWGRVGKDGKARDLHVEEAITCLRHRNTKTNPMPVNISDCTYLPLSAQSAFQIRNLASCNFFQVEEFRLNGQINFHTNKDSFQAFFAVNKDLKIVYQDNTFLLQKGQSCLLPAKIENFSIKADTDSIFIRSQIA